MSDQRFNHFGIVIAYVIPGFVALAGMTPLFPTVARWLRPVEQGDLGFGPPIYALLAATACGLILSCFRWLILDQHLHRWTGLRAPVWDDRYLSERLSGFSYLVENHFAFHLFAGNTLLAILMTYCLNRGFRTVAFLGWGTDLGMIILCLVLFTASRDALAKYFARTSRLIGSVAEKNRGTVMFNGNDHGGSGKAEHPGKPAKSSSADVTEKNPQSRVATEKNANSKETDKNSSTFRQS